MSTNKKICMLLFVLFCEAIALEGPIQKALQTAENQLRNGPLSSVIGQGLGQSLAQSLGHGLGGLGQGLGQGQSGPGYQTMVIYNEIMRQYYEVVKRYLDYKNRNINTNGIQNPEFRYLEELLSKMSLIELRKLLALLGNQ
ncbi:uncharacterized protein LOC106131272 [Amyelois transitella]|uniref:uncharacterized protein LOC106131272 n=1 Tax=Amyelois transitella TaxID=680683 RepID=UPI0029901A50|nr:uncharacterized protein LOC106131272 [Amyelois transitella]XP_013185770.2 uncharacterized protein LOC106131272 [Amyelois transitella]